MKLKMKGNDGTGNNINRDDWETPQWLWDLLNEQYFFTFDCCATKKNSKCDNFTNEFQLCFDFNDFNCWMNPPFSKAKEMFEHFFEVVYMGVAIYRCDNLETKVWQEIILKYADWIFIPKGRIVYEGKVGKGSRFPSALIGIGVLPPVNIEGKILKIMR